MITTSELAGVLQHYATLVDGNGAVVHRDPTRLVAKPLSGGLINDTYTLGSRHILQRLHSIFGAAVNEDIATLTAILRARGVQVPTLSPARDGRPFVELADGPDHVRGVWRVMNRLDGDTHHRLRDGVHARSAGRLVGEFHEALADVQHTFAFTRAGAHDTDLHMATLRRALQEHRDHRLFDGVATLADELFSRWRRWEGPGVLPTRICHGDLKVSNLLFDRNHEACAVLDLDTMAHLSLDVELGDALRSWCNEAAEDSERAAFSESTFEAALSGYFAAMAGALTLDESQSIVAGLQRICLELTARFAADALAESYFGWNPAIAPTRGDHNLLRARGQLDLARHVTAARPQLERFVTRFNARS